MTALYNGTGPILPAKGANTDFNKNSSICRAAAHEDARGALQRGARTNERVQSRNALRSIDKNSDVLEGSFDFLKGFASKNAVFLELLNKATIQGNRRSYLIDKSEWRFVFEK